MALNRDYAFRSGVGIVAALLSGTAGIEFYSPGSDLADNAFAGILLGVALLGASVSIKSFFRGVTNRRAGRDRRRPIVGSFMNDRRVRNLGNPFGHERRCGLPERRLGDRRSRFAM